jgi:hypothetical protein
MTSTRPGEPRTLISLSARIKNAAQAEGRPQRRFELVVANTVVGQMLPPGVIKGGMAIKLRVGEAASRFTRDLDATRPAAVSLVARRAQAWPPTVIAYQNWDTIYAAAAEGLDVIDDVNEAVVWTNRLIAEIARGGVAR